MVTIYCFRTRRSCHLRRSVKVEWHRRRAAVKIQIVAHKEKWTTQATENIGFLLLRVMILLWKTTTHKALHATRCSLMVEDECLQILICSPTLSVSMNTSKTISNRILKTMLRQMMSRICYLPAETNPRIRTESDLDSTRLSRVCKRSKKNRNLIQPRIWTSGKGILHRWISSRILSNNLVLVRAWDWQLQKRGQIFVLPNLVTLTQHPKQTLSRLIVTIIHFCKIRLNTHLITICNNKPKFWLLE